MKLFLPFFIFAITAVSSAQVKALKKVADDPTTCEYIKNALDYARMGTRKVENSYLLLIFRPGRAEKSTSISEDRTKFIRSILLSRDPTFDRQLVMAQGKVVNDLGRLEIYVGGKLEWDVYFKKNKAGWDSCIE
jgi:hypothetical protein